MLEMLRKRTWLFLPVMLIMLALAPAGLAAPAASVIYVDVDATTGANNGTSWGDAYLSLQDALGAWTSGDEIWVAEGRYFPDVGTAQTAGDRTASFGISGDTQLYGGFDGTEGTRGDRDPTAHVTVLSGDLGKDDGTDGDGVTLSYLTINPGDNSHQVVRFVGASNTGLLDGFAVSGGDGEFGGGIEIDKLASSQVVIRNARVQGNRVSKAGGGLYNLNTPMTLEDSEFLANAADDGDGQNANTAEGGGAYVANNTSGSVLQELQRLEFLSNFAEAGGGLASNLHNVSGTGLTLNHITFASNVASAKGGGMLHAHGTPTLTNVAFLENQVNPPFLLLASPHWGGGGLALVGPGSQPTLNNVAFAGNEAKSGTSGCQPNDGLGGAVHVLDAAPIMNNVLFSGNRSQSVGGAMFVTRPASSVTPIELNNATFAGNFSQDCGNGHALHYIGVPQVLVHNSILWGNNRNGTKAIFTEAPALQFKNSIVQGCDYTTSPPFTSCGADGGNTLTDDPLFVDQTPYTGGATSAGNNRLTIGSPAVDAGDNGLVKAGVTTDLDNRPRIVDGNSDATATVDMGAYELPFDCPPAGSTVLRVDKDATGANTGLTWTDALPTLQDALLLYKECSHVVDEIWVAEGVYYPDRGGYFGDPWTASMAERRQRSFHISNDGSGGIRIYGGFAGTENSPGDRGDPANNVTVLSGDIEHNDATNADGIVVDPSGIVGTNSNHVLYESGVDCSPAAPAGCPVLDRLTVTGGDAQTGGVDGSSPEEQGGGLWSFNSSSHLKDLRFQGNRAVVGGGLYLGGISDDQLDTVQIENNWARQGGGMASVDATHPKLHVVTFKGNRAQDSSGALGSGGGMYLATSSDFETKIELSAFLDNVADNYGGGLFTERDKARKDILATLDVVSFQGNRATGSGSGHGYGGGMANRGTSPQVDRTDFRANVAVTGGAVANLEGANAVFYDSLISGNAADILACGMYNDASSPHLTNLTFSGNNGGAVIANREGSNSVIRNIVLWANGGASYANDHLSVPLTSYSLVENCGHSSFWDTACGGDGGGNIEPSDLTDPIFVAPIDPATAPSLLGDFHLDINSVAIDAGRNVYNDHPTDLDWRPRISDGDGDGIPLIDMGAYEAPAAGRILTTKFTQPAGSDEAFAFELIPPEGETESFVLQDGDTYNSLNLAPGNYSVIETPLPPGWIAGAALCDNGDDPAAIDLKGGETVHCTFVNVEEDVFAVGKLTIPSGGTAFGFTDTITTPFQFSLDDGQFKLFTEMVPDTTYTVTEDDPTAANYDLVSIACDGTFDVLTVDLEKRMVSFKQPAGSAGACLFLNQARGGNIIVDKATKPKGVAKTFPFSLTGGPDGVNQAFSLTDQAPPYDSGFLRTGTYAVEEDVPWGWYLDKATCDDGSKPRAIDLSPGETVTCTFDNEKYGSIVVDKVTIPSGDPQAFQFVLRGGPEDVKQSFSLKDNSTPHDSGHLKAGTYSVSESLPDGWDLSRASCDDGSSPNAIDLDAGETVRCTFSNKKAGAKAGKILVDKVTDPSGDAQSFAFSLAGGPDNVRQDFLLTDGSLPHDSGDLKPGTYAVSEVVPDGWQQTSATCDGGDPGAIDLQAGETVYCTFANKKDAPAPANRIFLPVVTRN